MKVDRGHQANSSYLHDPTQKGGGRHADSHRFFTKTGNVASNNSARNTTDTWCSRTRTSSSRSYESHQNVGTYFDMVDCSTSTPHPSFRTDGLCNFHLNSRYKQPSSHTMSICNSNLYLIRDWVRCSCRPCFGCSCQQC